MPTDTLLLLLVILFFVTSSALEKWRRTRLSVKARNTPILLSFYTKNGIVNNVSDGIVGGMRYQYLHAMSDVAIDSTLSNLSSLLIRVELPFRTKVHLMGIAKNSGESQINPSYGKSIMERVRLESTYDSYFTLYAEKGQQIETRYHLDPAAMVFTIDFCGSHNWEIINDELYFAQSGEQIAGDKTSMLEDVETFVDEIAPAIKIPLTAKQKRIRTPYKEDRREKLVCPICNGSLLNIGDTVFYCENNDGYLISGAVLSNIRKGRLVLESIGNNSAVRTKELTCPSCDSPMKKTAYAKDQLIDSCTKCRYRWIDMEEVDNLKRVDLEWLKLS